MTGMSRVYFHYQDLEEHADGMWRTLCGVARCEAIQKSSKLLKEPDALASAMLLVLEMWPNSCEYEFTADSLNKIAWLGQAACCLAVGSPEECTRVAWHTLTTGEQTIANKISEIIITGWTTANSDQLEFPYA